MRQRLLRQDLRGVPCWLYYLRRRYHWNRALPRLDSRQHHPRFGFVFRCSILLGPRIDSSSRQPVIAQMESAPQDLPLPLALATLAGRPPPTVLNALPARRATLPLPEEIVSVSLLEQNLNLKTLICLSLSMRPLLCELQRLFGHLPHLSSRPPTSLDRRHQMHDRYLSHE